jgi:hypothetical protein
LVIIAKVTLGNMATKDIILAAVARNDQVITILGETDYAPSALQQSTAYVTELQTQMAAEEKNVKKAVLKLQKEQSEHEMYRDSHVKRLAYRMTGNKGKFEAKAEKEEREYHEALQARVQAEKKLETLKNTLKEAQASKSDHEKVAARHKKAQADLNALYDSIFNGPTPEFPEEDAAEVSVREAQQIYQDISGKLNIESQVIQLLSDADKRMNLARRQIDEALSYSAADIWGFGGPLADLYERDYLSQAQSHASNVEMLLAMARRSQPLVQSIGRMEIAQGNFISDVLFDNVFSDYTFHDKIKASEVELKRAHGKLLGQLKEAQERLVRAKGEVKIAEGRLQAARKSLERERMEAFRRVAAGEDVSVPAVVSESGAAREAEELDVPPEFEPPPAYEPPAYER